MNHEERQEKIKGILSTIKGSETDFPGIDIHLWIAAEGTPEHEDWLKACTKIVDCNKANGIVDLTSPFAREVQKYGRRY